MIFSREEQVCMPPACPVCRQAGGRQVQNSKFLTFKFQAEVFPPKEDPPPAETFEL